MNIPDKFFLFIVKKQIKIICEDTNKMTKDILQNQNISNYYIFLVSI